MLNIKLMVFVIPPYFVIFSCEREREEKLREREGNRRICIYNIEN